MAGDETPKGQSRAKGSTQVWWLVRILLFYTVWTAVSAVNTRQDLLLIGTGVGLVGLAVIATRPADQREA